MIRLIIAQRTTFGITWTGRQIRPILCPFSSNQHLNGLSINHISFWLIFESIFCCCSFNARLHIFFKLVPIFSSFNSALDNNFSYNGFSCYFDFPYFNII